MAGTPTASQRAQEWFDLSLYERASEFELTKWVEQIAKRAAIKSAINANDKILLDALVPDLIGEPFADYDFKYINTTQSIKDLDYTTGAVIPLGFSDLKRLQLLRLELSLDELDAGDELKLQNIFDAGDELTLQSFLDVIDELKLQKGHDAIDEWSSQNEALQALRHFGHLKVDLNARDADILANFQHWLTTYRATVEVDGLKMFYRRDFAAETADWRKSKILPYFDLTAWAKWSGVKLTDSDKVDLLFPHYTSFSTRDKLRSIQRKAAEILTMSNAMALSKAVGN